MATGGAIGVQDRDRARRPGGVPPSTIQLIRDLPIGALLVDADGRRMVENERLGALWQDVVRDPVHGIVPAVAYGLDGTLIAPSDWPIWRSLRDGAVLAEVQMELERSDGEPISLLVASRPLDSGSDRVGALMLVSDASPTREAGQLREAFVSVLSHELRTPITSIYSGIALLERHQLDAATHDDVLRDVAVEAESLYRIVEDLLVMVRLERGVALVHRTPLLVQHVVGLALADERRRWPEHTFVESLPAHLPPVLADEGLVRQVLRNLLSNAAKYGGPAGRVGVVAGVRGDEVVVQVNDEGPGIDPGDRDQVFALFYRGDMGARAPGAGIGLYVARSLVEAMGGRIWVSDRPRGAEVAFALPLLDLPDAPSFRPGSDEGFAAS